MSRLNPQRQKRLFETNSKSRFRMYKAGKQWLVAGIATLSGLFGMGAVLVRRCTQVQRTRLVSAKRPENRMCWRLKIKRPFLRVPIRHRNQLRKALQPVRPRASRRRSRLVLAIQRALLTQARIARALQPAALLVRPARQ